MTSLNITIAEGGESLYLHPVAFYPFEQAHRNRWLYFVPQEFAPYQSFFLLHTLVAKRQGVPRYFMNVLHHSLFRFAIALKRTLLFWVQLREIKWHWLEWHWDTALPLHCASLGKAFSVPYQLAIVDPDEWVDQSYLVPTQSYLAQCVERYLASVTEADAVRYPKKVEYLTWVKTWQDKGCEIGWLCSVDT